MNIKNSFVFIIISVFMLFACGKPLENEVINSYSDGTPSKVIYFKWVGDNKVIMKESKYYFNGKIQEEYEVKDGQKHGLCTNWYEEIETKWFEDNYTNGIKNGKTILWYKSGEKNYEGTYKNGLQDGEWTFWDAKGDKTKTVTYAEGKIIKEKTYN